MKTITKAIIITALLDLIRQSFCKWLLLLAIFYLFRNRGRKPLSLLSRSGIRLQARDGTGEKLRFTLYLPQEPGEEDGGDRFRRTASTTRKSAQAAVVSWLQPPPHKKAPRERGSTAGQIGALGLGGKK